MLTPIEFDFALRDFNEQNLLKQRFDAELMRLQTAYLINVNLQEKDQFTDPRKLLRFPWEAEEIKETGEPDWERLEREIKGIE